MSAPGPDKEASQIPADSPPPDAGARVDAPPPAPAYQPPPASAPAGGDLVQERPELLVAGAFVGAFLVAKILRRIGS